MNSNFLQEIKKIQELHEKQKELSGENFNIFSIMSMESDEVFTHSALISELLNPKGTHGLGTKPLELFSKIILEDEFSYDFQQMSCLKEEHIGFISEDKSEGGRLDIVVKDKEENGFVIENKIYADEQINQLSRYSKRYPKAKILYLTLFGKESDQFAITNDDEKIYQSISYENHILNWMSECAKIAFDKPMLREVINQYILLIKKLTHQSTDKIMESQIQEIIQNNISECSEIYQNYLKVITKIKLQVLGKIEEKLKIKYPQYKIITKEIEKKQKAVFVEDLPNDFILLIKLKSNNSFSLNFYKIGNLPFENILAGLKTGNNNKYYKWYKNLPDTDFSLENIDSTIDSFVEDIENIIKALN